VSDHWNVCLTCSTVCPYTKPNVWWRTLAVRTLTSTPRPARPVVVRALKWVDDQVWGKVANKRVRWLGYDSGIKPGVKACTVAGCTAQHGLPRGAQRNVGDTRQLIQLETSASNIGYYAPLKENVNRFAKRS